MRIGRSLSPGKLFFEKQGVLKKVSIKDLQGIDIKRSGYHRISIISRHDMLFQWGTSDSLSYTDRILFPIAFSGVPTIRSESQTGRVHISDISTTGFTLETTLESVRWTAYGPG